MSYLKLDHVRLWYDDIGDGPAIVFLHPGSCSCKTWDKQKDPVIEAGFRFVTYDRPAVGQSVVLDHDHEAPKADELSALLDHIGVETCHLVASGAGGEVAVRFALKNPRRVESITLSASLGGFRDQQLGELLRNAVTPELMQLPWHLIELSAGYRGSDPEGLKAWSLCSQSSPNVLSASVSKRVAEEIFTPSVSALGLPILLIGGGADWLTAPVYIRSVHALLPGSQLEIVREVGHAPHWEDPQNWNDVLFKFLAGIGKSLSV